MPAASEQRRRGAHTARRKHGVSTPCSTATAVERGSAAYRTAQGTRGVDLVLESTTGVNLDFSTESDGRLACRMAAQKIQRSARPGAPRALLMHLYLVADKPTQGLRLAPNHVLRTPAILGAPDLLVPIVAGTAARLAALLHLGACIPRLALLVHILPAVEQSRAVPWAVRVRS